MTKSRKVLRKVLKVAAVVLVMLIAGLAVAGVYFVRRPWPQVDGNLAVAGLEAPVEVVRDRWGVPHVYAEGEHDLFFAQGYVHAQDRLWQMEFNRHASHGTLAEILGPPLVDADRYLRTVGLHRAAARDWEALGDEPRAMLEAYAAGVNAFLAGHHGTALPLEFTLLGFEPKPWTPIDSLAWGKLMGLTLSLNHPMEILRRQLVAKIGEDGMRQLLAPYSADAPVIVPPAGETAAPPLAAARRESGRGQAVLAALLGPPGTFWGSNSWVVHGSRTATGKPLLANDTHLGLAMPSIWYEIGLHGGDFDVRGFSFPGMPLVVIGQNRRTAWGITNMCADVQDFYLERLDDPENPTRYEYQGEWHDLEVVSETIAQKGAEPSEYKVLLTRHGPLMNAVMPEIASDEPLALQWNGTDGGRLVEALRRLNLAQSWEEFQTALAVWDSPSLNVSYADADGHIGYQSTGKIPIRPAGDDGLMPVPGWTGEHEWQGTIPWQEMPRAFDPPAGFIVTANNKVVSDDYPYHLAYDMADGYRARRITEELRANGRLSLDDVRRLQADVLSLPAAALVPHLRAVEPADERERRALATLADWSYELDAESAGAGLFQAWFYFLWSEVLADELGDSLMSVYRVNSVAQVPVMIDLLADPDSPWFDDVTTPELERRDEIVHRSLTRAVDWLAERYGEDPAGWTWGRLHAVTFSHVPFGQSGIGLLEKVFNSATFAAAGDPFTVNSQMADYQNPFATVFGVSQRLIVDLDDLGRSLAVNSTGQVAHAFHRHREDQIPLWSRVEYHPVLTTREAVDAAAEATLRLTPPP